MRHSQVTSLWLVFLAMFLAVTAFAVTESELQRRLYLVGTLSDICVLGDQKTDKVYTLKVGQSLPLSKKWRVTAVSRRGIYLSYADKKIHLLPTGRPEHLSSHEKDETETEPESLSYYQKILNKKNQGGQKQWQPIDLKELIICDAHDEDCIIDEHD